MIAVVIFGPFTLVDYIQTLLYIYIYIYNYELLLLLLMWVAKCRKNQKHFFFNSVTPTVSEPTRLCWQLVREFCDVCGGIWTRVMDNLTIWK